MTPYRCAWTARDIKLLNTQISKLTFVATKHVFCSDKHVFDKTRVFRDKSTLVTHTKKIIMFSQQFFVFVFCFSFFSFLSRQEYFCRNKTFVCVCVWQNVCRDKNDTCGSSSQWYPCMLRSEVSLIRLKGRWNPRGKPTNWSNEVIFVSDKRVGPQKPADLIIIRDAGSPGRPPRLSQSSRALKNKVVNCFRL